MPGNAPCVRAKLDQITKVPEFLRRRLFEPFEQHHFNGDAGYSFQGQPVYRRIDTCRGAAGDGVDHDEDVIALLFEAKRGLQHADMRFRPAEDQLAAMGMAHEFLNIGILGAGEMRLLHDFTGFQRLAQCRDTMPQPLRILLAAQDRHG